MEGSDKRSAEDQRQHSRIRFFGVVFLSWEEPGGDENDDNHVMGRCVDISEGGLAVLLSKRIFVGTQVRVRADWVKLDGPATVRHSREVGGVFQLGLQFKRPLSPEILATVIVPESIAPPG
jgi:PilZ domain